VRLFVAIGLPPTTRAEIDSELVPLRRTTVAVRWIQPESLHLTLEFLGWVADDRIVELNASLGPVAARSAPFTMRLEGFGGFPDIRRARVFWIGIQVSEALTTLQRSVEQALAEIGFEPEARGFHPHVTVGRAVRAAKRSDLTGLAHAAESFTYRTEVPVQTIELMRSDLRRSGAIYSEVHSFPLVGESDRVQDSR
jgi:2'-5' RNA ligase